MAADSKIRAARDLLEREGYRVLQTSMPGQREDAWVHLYHGGKGGSFHPLSPEAEQISLDAIAHGLSLECRFGSQTSFFYPVALHCYRGSYLFEDASDALDFMLHDASEGLGLRDLPSPIKRLPEMSFYLELERSVMSAVAARFRRRPDFWERPKIKVADDLMLHLESAELLSPGVPSWTRTLTAEEYASVPVFADAVPPAFAKELWLLRLAEVAGVAGLADIADEAKETVVAHRMSRIGTPSPQPRPRL